MKLLIEKSYNCTDLYGEPTGNMLSGKGPVIVELEPLSITIDVKAYCLTRPLPDPVGPFPVTYTYNAEDDTLIDNLGTIWTRK